MSSAATSSFRNIKLRTRRPDCAVCGDAAAASRAMVAAADGEGEAGRSGAGAGHLVHELRQEPLTRGPMDACAGVAGGETLQPQHRVSCAAYAAVRSRAQAGGGGGGGALLVDVRDATQFAMCHLPEAVNLPLHLLTQRAAAIEDACMAAAAEVPAPARASSAAPLSWTRVCVRAPRAW